MRYKKLSTLHSLILIGGLGIGTAQAATFNVTKTADSNDGTCNADCSLREAVVAANAQAGADIINVPAGTYQLTIPGINEEASATGDLDVTDDLTINGTGSSQTIIDGNTIDRVIDIAYGVNAELNDLSIINGVTNILNDKSSNGAGLHNRGNTTLNNLHFEGNVAEGGGGAIENRSSSALYTNNIIINSSRFTGNCAGYGGGAIDSGGKLTITDSIFDGNVPMSKAGVNCSNINGGGAIHVVDGDNATIDSSTFVNNIGASGAITGGGINGELTITNTTFANNQGLDGPLNAAHAGAGAIEDQTGNNHFTLINSTIVSNTAANSGGGIHISPFAPPHNPEIEEGSITLVNTIVANNSAPTGADCSGTIISNGNNIFGTVAGCDITTQSTDVIGDPQLQALTTDTITGQSYFPLSSTSPAIDAANNSTCPATDQIGSPRPIDGDSIVDCDIGAYEYGTAVQADVCPSGCAYSTIQAAVNAAATNDTILVGSGAYPESVVINKALTLKSTSGSANTIVDATGLGQSVFSISHYTTIDGFTITGGQTTSGAGLNVSSGGLTLKNSTIKNNSATYGGGVYANSYVYLLLEDNIFDSNTAGSTGGAILLSAYATQIVNRNVFTANSASNGGAIVASHIATTVKNNIFVNNHNSLYFPSYASPNIINNTIVGSTGYAARKGPYGSMHLRNSILWNNASNLQGSGWTVQNSLIDVNPLFVNEANGDYRLQAGSPAIDTGMDGSSFGVTADFDSVARPQDGDGQDAGSTGDGSDYDIGAFEFK